MAGEITNSDDTIDVRDVIERIEELTGAETRDDDEQRELAALQALLLECKSAGGGDLQHEGVWYPVTLIRDSHFEDYAQELAEDIGAINRDAQWPNNFIDWKAAAEALQGDYTSVEFEGVTYWTR